MVMLSFRLLDNISILEESNLTKRQLYCDSFSGILNVALFSGSPLRGSRLTGQDDFSYSSERPSILAAAGDAYRGALDSTANRYIDNTHMSTRCIGGAKYNAECSAKDTNVRDHGDADTGYIADKAAGGDDKILEGKGTSETIGEKGELKVPNRDGAGNEISSEKGYEDENASVSEAARKDEPQDANISTQSVSPTSPLAGEGKGASQFTGGSVVEIGVGGEGKGVRSITGTEATANTNINIKIPDRVITSKEGIASDVGTYKLSLDSLGENLTKDTSADISALSYSNPYNYSSSDSFDGLAQNPEFAKIKISERITSSIQDKLSFIGEFRDSIIERPFVFTTGLAEHIVRLLTDKFDHLLGNFLQASQDGVGSAVTNIANVTNTSLTNALPTNSSDFLAHAYDSRVVLLNKISDTDDLLGKTVDIIRTNIGLRTSRASLRLEPPELGRIHIEVKLIGNDLHISISTETAEARHILQSRSDLLRASLEQSNINVVRFEVLQANREASHQQHFYDDNYEDSQGRYSQGGSDNSNSEGRERDSNGNKKGEKNE